MQPSYSFLFLLALLIIASAADPRVAAAVRSWQKIDSAHEAHLDRVEKARPGTRAWLAAGY